ncbi:putative exodeoxyribonuclease 8 domain protein, partial [Escherichia coli 93.0055]
IWQKLIPNQADF